MLFPSFAFLVFLPLVFLGYWYAFAKNLRLQNIFLLVASYLFYGWWDWRFLGLLFFSSVADFLIGLAIDRAPTIRTKKRWVALSVLINLSLLGTFKYFNFFVDGMHDLLATVGLQPNLPLLRILLPVGISFYTFQSLSYTIDIRRGSIKATHDPIAFLAFVSFFPQLVAGPIERATNLLPQFLTPRQFDRGSAVDGLRQMLWGFFKKLVVADTCGVLANEAFAGDVSATPGISLFFGVFFFAFQIYGDFSGYSDIAIGCARLFGIRLSQNFATPYFSRSISEFWRRWHISLSTWFRDYVYMPLGGWRTKWGRLRNILITFAVSGLWHGANWTFIVWGILHGLFYVPEILRNGKARRDVASLRDLPSMLWTFTLVLVAWVFFRSATVRTAFAYLYYMVANAFLHPGALLKWLARPEFGWVLVLLVVEWLARKQEHALERLPDSVVLRWAIYLLITLVLLLYIDLSVPNEFIYFQF
jgi:D-alanyl-lipoteichoic acid acyltransferase DltB (MBOAT superfamily)